MSTNWADRESEASADERDLGWGGRDWADSVTSSDEADRDLARLLDERPPHHEERDR